MANETVKELAEVVGVSVDKLLQQMQDAGLSHAGSDHVVTDDEKQALLSFLKKAHGQDSDSKKITLRRKSVSQVKVSGQSGRSKTVSVEVRKKRTYVKRDDTTSVEDQTQEAADAAALEDLQQANLLESNAAESIASSEQSTIENQNTVHAEQYETVVKKPSSYDDTPNKRANRTHVDDRGRPKRSAVLDVVSTSSRATESALPIDAEAKQREVQKREEERKRRDLDEKTRKEKDELARKKTLEAAKRVAEELEKRGGSVDSIQQLQQDEPEVGGTILKQALEESYAAKEKDDRRIKRVKKSQQQENTKLVLNRNRKLRGSGQHGFQSPTGPIRRDVRVGEDISVADLANQMSLKATKVIGTLMKLGVVATVNQNIDRDTAIIVVEELGHNPVLTREDELEHDFQALV
ncbi:MAG: translation initiation factor IF-2 N-terminal domain-containing protein, partial [Pseudomonadota bacterium]